MALDLTPAESLLRQCLLDCRRQMRCTPGMSDLVLRFTGGWVRDKLLGVQSHDVDVALSTMTGWQFGQALRSFMKENGPKYEEEAARQGFKAEIKNLHKIAANPEKSKHLETITTRMFGIDLDFVNLRKEVYEETSRNPQMEFGTAAEDALRRDATVNALFYNLDSQIIEDFTGRGLSDMDKKIIRTPLAPHQTFRDDPLRVLRLIRFACRLNYTIEAEAEEAMKDSAIHEALRSKISRERVGVEIGKIVSGPDPYTGLKYINDFDLYDTVFADPVDSTCPDKAKAQSAYEGLQTILNDRSSIYFILRPGQDQALSWILAAYVPWHDLAGKAYVASREGIKATNLVSRVLDEAVKARPMIVKIVDLVLEGNASRGKVGLMIRNLKEFWRSHILYSILCEIAEGDYSEAARRYGAFLAFVKDQNLEEAVVIDRELVLKGNEIRAALGGPKGGPWLKAAVDMVAEWQFDQKHPTKDQATEMILGRKSELGLG